MVFQGRNVVLTNHRLLAKLGRYATGDHDEALLRDIAPPEKFNGGKQGRMREGTRLFGVGLALIVVEAILESSVLNDKVATVLFALSGLLLVVGVYFVAGSVFQVKPNTTVVFPVHEGKNIIIPFPEWDNSDAEDLTRQFARAKRGL